jgi:GT2 family glycosyltransferase
MDLSIIVVNWRVKRLLRKCLSSIFSCPPRTEFEVIVVDNDSADGSVEMIRQDFPQVRVIANPGNYGFARACNQGMTIAQGRYLFLLNPDSELTAEACDRVVAFMETHPRVGIAGCHLYYPDGRGQVSFCKFTSLSNTLGRALLLCFFLPRNRLTAPLFSDYLGPNESIGRVCGGAMVLRRQTLEQIGLFDESFFLYAEDEDLCYRARHMGWEIAPVPDTKVIHHHDQSGRKNVRKAIFSSYRSQFLLYRKHHSAAKVFVFRSIQFVAVLIRSAFWALRAACGAEKDGSKQRLLAYVSILLSDYNYRKSLIKQN